MGEFMLGSLELLVLVIEGGRLGGRGQARGLEDQLGDASDRREGGHRDESGPRELI
jgi:hypothetical protein